MVDGVTYDKGTLLQLREMRQSPVLSEGTFRLGVQHRKRKSNRRRRGPPVKNTLAIALNGEPLRMKDDLAEGWSEFSIKIGGDNASLPCLLTVSREGGSVELYPSFEWKR